jgi:LuxR family transcriptional regulator, maltose regulon positive regulatory protein
MPVGSGVMTSKEGFPITVHLVARPRLVELIGARWQLRVVLLVAGPGFGKSVLVSQAMRENLLAPRGVDVFVGFTAADRSPAHVLRGIADSAGIETARPQAMCVDWLLAELARRWPLGVCVVLDDVHHVLRYDEGVRLLSRLVNEAPSSVHFVLASRDPVRGLAQLRLSGAVLEVDEEQLTLTYSEMCTLAALHDVDSSVPASTGGWPAAASMAAAYGISGVEEYVFEAVMNHLDDVERRVLAIAAAIGGGDAALLRTAIGKCDVDPAALLSRLPLISVSDTGTFTIHDLWSRVIGDAVGEEDLQRAVSSAVDVMIERDQFDRAFRLCVAHRDWQQAANVLTACCRHGHVEVLPDVLAEWLAALPADRKEEPDGLLLRGLAGRLNDPFGQQTADLLGRAVDGYRAIGNVAGEVAAGVELFYVLRNQGRCDLMPAFLARVAELEAAGHAEAAGPAAVGRAFFAELSGDDRQMAAQLAVVPTDMLSRDWQTVVAFRLAMSHLILGDEHEMMDAATRCASLAGDSNDRHVLALAHWLAGNPAPALAACEEMIADAARSRLDAVILGTTATMVLATAGRTGEAAARLQFTEQAASGPISALLRGALVGVRALLAAATDHDDDARAMLEAALAETPLSDPMGWRMAARWLPLAYVLVPSIRDELDQRDLGPIHQRRLSVARAVAAAREGRRPHIDVPTMTPQAVATSVPLPWAMALAARLTTDGARQGREIAEYLLELYGEPARIALRGAMCDEVRQIASGARKLLAAVPIAPRQPIRLCVLGPTALRVGDLGEVNHHWNRDRVRSLLLYLIVHGPSHREQIIDALWPHLDLSAADRNLRVTLSYLNQVLEPDRQNGEAPFFIRQTGPTLTLAGRPHLDVDIDGFESLVNSAEEADHRGLPSVALDMLEQALKLWRGPCLSDVAYEDWAQTPCRDLTARYVSAALRAAELHLSGGRHGWAVECARRALAVDEWSEPAHRILIASALSRGDGCAAARALVECDAMLASLGIAAGPQTEMLRRRLAVGPAALDVAAIA